MKNIIIILLIALSYNSYAQLEGQALIDSLKAELPQAKADIDKVILLNQLSFAHPSINPDKGINYGNKSVLLAKKLGKAKVLADAYNTLGANYKAKSDYKNAINNFSKSLQINEDLDYKEGIAANLINLGNIYNLKSNYSEALLYYEKSIKLYKELGNKEGLAAILANIGSIYTLQSEFPKALKEYGKALKLHEELENKTAIAMDLTNMGIIYERQSDYQKALEIYKKSSKFFEELGHNYGIAHNFGSIGVIYYYQKNYSEALKYHKKALEINQKLNYEQGIAVNLGNIGLVYEGKANYIQSIDYYGKALEINKRLGNKLATATNLGNIGNLSLKLSQDSVKINQNDVNKFLSSNKKVNLNNAINYLNESIKLYEEIEELNYRSTFLKNLANAYKIKGNHLKRAEALEEHQKLKDSVFNEEKAKEIGKLEAEREQLEAEYALKEADRIKQEKINRRNTIQYSLISVITIIIFAFIFYFMRRNVSFGTIDTLTFVAFLLLYEFILVLTEPWVDDWTDNIPLYKLLVNIGIALIFVPLQKLEQKIKGSFKKD